MAVVVNEKTGDCFVGIGSSRNSSGTLSIAINDKTGYVVFHITCFPIHSMKPISPHCVPIEICTIGEYFLNKVQIILHSHPHQGHYVLDLQGKSFQSIL